MNRQLLTALPIFYSLLIISGLLTPYQLTAQEIDYQLYTQAMQAKNIGQPQAAIHHLTLFLQQYPEDYPLAYQQRGRLHYQLQQFERAVADFERHCQMEPGQADSHFALGQSYLQLRQPEAALAQFNRCLQQDPRHAKAYNERGRLYCQRRQYDAALEDFYRASELDPSFALPCNNAGAARYYNQNVANPTRKDLEIARDWFSKAIERDSSMMLALRNRAAMHLFLQAYPEALMDLQRAQQLAPKDAMIHFYFGVAYADQEHYDAAEAAFGEALRLQPQLAVTHEELGNLYKAQQRFEEAIRSYRAAQRVEPRPNKRYIGLMEYRIALTAAQRGQEGEALGGLRKAQRLKVFQDRQVYSDLLHAKELDPLRSSKAFKKIIKSLGKEKKDNMFINSGLAWFRMRK
ncbi:MAG: tetratricopeptide repeat protein [Bacteroidota bacterium]